MFLVDHHLLLLVLLLQLHLQLPELCGENSGERQTLEESLDAQQ